jgi:peroxiredoxin
MDATRRHVAILAVSLLGMTALTPGPASAQEKAAAPSAAGGTSAGSGRMLEPGAAAPDFTLRDTAGEAFRFAEENARKPVLIVFWSVFCEPCRFELPLIQRIHDRYREPGLAVVAIALDGEPLRGTVAGFARQEGYTFRVAIDELEGRETFRVAESYGVGWMPALFLVEKGGKVGFARSGRIPEEELEKALHPLLTK